MHTDNAVNVLVIDDAAKQHSPLKHLLSELGATLVSARSGEEALIRVTDTGIGISKDMLSKIFARFLPAG